MNESNGHTTEHGYRVEARDAGFNCRRPLALHDGCLGPDWREVNFVYGDNPAGIPCEQFGHKREHELLTHESALVLAWTLIAQNPWSFIEARLVRYRLETTYNCERLGIVDMPVLKSALFHEVALVEETPGPVTEEVKGEQ